VAPLANGTHLAPDSKTTVSTRGRCAAAAGHSDGADGNGRVFVGYPKLVCERDETHEPPAVLERTKAVCCGLQLSSQQPCSVP
jgi:hypothetical protein